MGVGDVVAIHSGGIALHRSLFHGVDDLCAVVEFGQISKAPGPVLGCGDGLGGNHIAISQKVDGDGGGTNAILVVVVIPGLAAGKAHNGRSMGVDHIIAIEAGSIALNSLFHDFVVDQIAVVISLGQSAEVILPLVSSGNRFGIDDLTVCQQADSNALRAQAVLVIAVVPDLLTGDADSLQVDGVIAVGGHVKVQTVITAVPVTVAVFSGGLDAGKAIIDGNIIIGLGAILAYQIADNGRGGRVRNLYADAAHLAPFVSTGLGKTGVGNAVDHDILNSGDIAFHSIGIGSTLIKVAVNIVNDVAERDIRALDAYINMSEGMVINAGGAAGFGPCRQFGSFLNRLLIIIRGLRVLRGCGVLRILGGLGFLRGCRFCGLCRFDQFGSVVRCAFIPRKSAGGQHGDQHHSAKQNAEEFSELCHKAHMFSSLL